MWPWSRVKRFAARFSVVASPWRSRHQDACRRSPTPFSESASTLKLLDDEIPVALRERHCSARLRQMREPRNPPGDGQQPQHENRPTPSAGRFPRFKSEAAELRTFWLKPDQHLWLVKRNDACGSSLCVSLLEPNWQDVEGSERENLFEIPWSGDSKFFRLRSP